ncbi:MAG: GNAT family N-acetyltransferase [Oscillibacter sp.]|nr:GNAT family N-acetyltransferase [Oscillibacter sp.]
MLNRTIPFYNTILRCDKYHSQQIKLPDSYMIVPYRNGLETDWARLECAVGDFLSAEEAMQYFLEKYPNRGNDDDILFLLNDEGRVVGSCIVWEDERQGGSVNSLHWLVVDEQYQGNGLGRALCCETMNRFHMRDKKAIYIHTQPWSWKAILLYVSLGFRLQKTDTFAAYINQYGDAMKTLKGILSAKQYHLLELASDN